MLFYYNLTLKFGCRGNVVGVVACVVSEREREREIQVTTGEDRVRSRRRLFCFVLSRFLCRPQGAEHHHSRVSQEVIPRMQIHFGSNCVFSSFRFTKETFVLIISTAEIHNPRRRTEQKKKKKRTEQRNERSRVVFLWFLDGHSNILPAYWMFEVDIHTLHIYIYRDIYCLFKNDLKV